MRARTRTYFLFIAACACGLFIRANRTVGIRASGNLMATALFSSDGKRTIALPASLIVPRLDVACLSPCPSPHFLQDPKVPKQLLDKFHPEGQGRPFD